MFCRVVAQWLYLQSWPTKTRVQAKKSNCFQRHHSIQGWPLFSQHRLEFQHKGTFSRRSSSCIEKMRYIFLFLKPKRKVECVFVLFLHTLSNFFFYSVPLRNWPNFRRRRHFGRQLLKFWSQLESSNHWTRGGASLGLSFKARAFNIVALNEPQAWPNPELGKSKAFA